MLGPSLYQHVVNNRAEDGDHCHNQKRLNDNFLVFRRPLGCSLFQLELNCFIFVPDERIDHERSLITSEIAEDLWILAAHFHERVFLFERRSRLVNPFYRDVEFRSRKLVRMSDRQLIFVTASSGTGGGTAPGNSEMIDSIGTQFSIPSRQMKSASDSFPWASFARICCAL